MRQAYYISNQQTQGLTVDIPSVSLNDIQELELTKVSYWLIDMRNWQQGWENLCFIRRHLSSDIYLKPVVFLVGVNEIPKDIKKSSDGNIDISTLTSIVIEDFISKLESINLWIDKLSHQEKKSDSNISFKILRILASRNCELKPIATVRRSSGFVYPIIEPLFTKRDRGALEILNFLKKQSLLTEKFVTRAHFCGHCSSAFLNFKETCPHCAADDLSTDELVHHFKCAHTAELSEFQQGDRLVCPKCERQLRHIGIDYDKPSVVSRCNQCNHRFQDPVVLTECYSCGRTAEPSTQDVQRINAYTVSAIGQNAAYYGLDALFTNMLETELYLYSTNAFHDFFQVEVARIERYKISTSSLAMINFNELDNLYIQLGKNAKHVFAELSSIFKAVFRESDVITAHNESIFFVLMTETSLQDAQRGMDRLEESMTALFESNLEIKLQLKTTIMAIDNELNLADTLELFLENSVKAD